MANQDPTNRSDRGSQTQTGNQNRGSQRSGVSRKGPQDPESKKRGQIDDRKS